MNLSSSRIFRKFQQFLNWLWNVDGSPAERARGIAVGIFSGCFPLFGFQTIFGVMLASLVNGNRLLAATGTWISNPFTYIPLYLFNYKIGLFILGEKSDFKNLRQFNTEEIWSHGWSISIKLFIGSFTTGLVFGSFFGFLVYLLLSRKK